MQLYARGSRRAGGRARSDAEEALGDSQAEINDISAAFNTSDKVRVNLRVNPQMRDALTCQMGCCSAESRKKKPKRNKQSKRRNYWKNNWMTCELNGERRAAGDIGGPCAERLARVF